MTPYHVIIKRVEQLVSERLINRTHYNRIARLLYEGEDVWIYTKDGIIDARTGDKIPAPISGRISFKSLGTDLPTIPTQGAVRVCIDESV